MGKPKISICIPAYNNAEEVRRLLDSIFKQTFQDWEIILTDDSTNEEISVLVKETAQDRLHYIHNEKPLGHKMCIRDRGTGNHRGYVDPAFDYGDHRSG